MIRRTVRLLLLCSVFGVAALTSIGAAQAQDRIVSVSAGTDVTCVLDTRGDVQCWGRNDVGQLGRGTSDTRAHPAPVRVALRARAIALSVGRDHACALVADSSAYCWGDDRMAESGAETHADRCEDLGMSVPCRVRPVRVGGGQRFRSIAAGFHETCGISLEHRVLCWGNAFADPQSSDSTGLERCGAPNVRSWCRRRPTLFPIMTRPPTGRPYLASLDTLAIGAYGSCAAAQRDIGYVYCWRHGSAPGENHGTGSGAFVEGLWSASMGDEHACGVGHDQALFCWGTIWIVPGDSLYKHRPIRGPFRPVDAARRFSAVSVGAMHSCAIEAVTRRLFCWGANQYGQLGIGVIDPLAVAPLRAAHPRPEPLRDLHRFVMVSAGLEHTCALTVEGELYCWGRALRGVLGDRDEPVVVPLRMSLRYADASDR